MPDSRPETGLLLCCARVNRTPEVTERIRVLLRDEVDWTYIRRAAHGHGLAPLLYWHLSDSFSEAVPSGCLDQLRDHFHANRLRNLMMTGELLTMMDTLEACGIPVIPYKGPTLAVIAYGNLALREFTDLDVLVPKGYVLQAKEVLTSMGYQPQNRMLKTREAAFLRHERQYVFTRGDGIAVELHWRVTPGYFPFSLDPKYLWGRTESISLGGGTVRTFSREDLLLTLCVHGAVHRWERLAWICDIAELVRASGEMDWERLIERATALNSKRVLLIGLFLAHDLLGMDLEERVLREVRADAVVGALAEEVRERLFSEATDLQGILEGYSFRRFHLQVIERPQDKLRYFSHRALTPTLAEWEFLPLPAVLSPFYRLLRPILLTAKFGRRLASRFL